MRSTCSDCAASGGYLSSWLRLPFIREGVALVILFKKVWGVNILNWFPGVVTFGVPFPFHKVLERSRPSLTSVVDQVFHLVLLCALYQIWWGLREIGAMDGVFLIGEQK